MEALDPQVLGHLQELLQLLLEDVDLAGVEEGQQQLQLLLFNTLQLQKRVAALDLSNPFESSFEKKLPAERTIL